MMRDDAPQAITPQLLLQAYAAGLFPMADSAQSDEIFWVDPERRGVLPLDGLHVSRSLRKRILKDDFKVSVNTDFGGVVHACADRAETWINPVILGLYGDLRRMGYAHSIEVRGTDGKLQGGLYGVALGGAFFGESMFSRATDMSKIALVWLVARLNAGGFTLLDTQFVTPHLATLGVREIPKAKYHKRLSEALQKPANFWRQDRSPDAHSVLQLSTQIS